MFFYRFITTLILPCLLWVGAAGSWSVYTDFNDVLDRDLAPAAIAPAAHPNPFNPTTTIGFTIPADGPATLAVYNLAGQKVRTLLDGSMVAGSHTIVWDGTNDTGRAVAAGVYLTRLTAGNMTATGKLALVK